MYLQGSNLLPLYELHPNSQTMPLIFLLRSFPSAGHKKVGNKMVHSPVSLHAAHHSPGTPGSPHVRTPGGGKYNRPTNTLTTTLPGFTNPVSLPFPEKCLPVCIRCKKNYKTRELCRVRDGHTDLPWSLTYVCVSLDESCIDPQTGRIIDGPFESRSLDFHQPFCEKEKVPGTTPICASCKEKNYTRAYCREKQKHNQLPWSTVYVSLTRAHNGEPAIPVPESPGAGSVRSREDREEKDDADCRSTKKLKTVPGSVADSPSSGVIVKKETTEEGPESEPLFPVPASRTFLLEVSGKSTVLRVSIMRIRIKCGVPRFFICLLPAKSNLTPCPLAFGTIFFLHYFP